MSMVQVRPGNQDANETGGAGGKTRIQLHAIEARFINAYEKVLARDGTTASLAKILNCSESYVRMMYKHHQLRPLKPSNRPWGGRRAGAGRKKGSRNRDTMMIEQYYDNKTNSLEVGISSQTRLTKKDYWQYTKSSANNTR